MSAFLDKYFGPLGKDSCMYFYIFSIIAGVSFMITLIGAIIVIITHFKKMDYLLLSNMFFMLLNMFIIYFVNRLLHSMCIKSLV
jgi:hypothetical protein